MLRKQFQPFGLTEESESSLFLNHFYERFDIIYGITPNLDLEHYNNYDDIVRYLNEVANLNPKIASLRVIGITYERRQILGLKIGYPITDGDKRAIWIDGGNHGREWPAVHTALLVINQLISNYGLDDRITNYVNQLNFYIFPVLNPDGYVYSRSSNDSLVRQWRKNRAPSNCSGSIAYRKGICCYGVDINRNYDFEFKQSNLHFNNPCSDEYQGPFPFSEPESRAVRDYLLGKELRDNVDLLISLHTHGEMIILPYNHRKKAYPGDYHDLQSLARKAAEKISEDGGTEYQIGTAADMIGPATGGASDWIKNNTSIKFVYVIELPPDLLTSFAFQMKPHWLVPTFAELWRGLRVFIDEIISWRLL